MRPPALACVLVLLGGALACNKPEQGRGEVASPGSSAAGTEAATARPKPGAAKAELTSASHPSALAEALVEVVSMPPGSAEPCERVCGRLGDCLFESEDFIDVEAGALELECLDLCVHAPVSAASRTALLACESRQGCAELRSCAQTQWTKLAEVRESPAVEGFVTATEPCKEGCRWFFSCIFTGMAPGDAYLDPSTEMQMHECERSCDDPTMLERETYIHFGSCLPDHCGYGRIEECWRTLGTMY